MLWTGLGPRSFLFSLSLSSLSRSRSRSRSRARSRSRSRTRAHTHTHTHRHTHTDTHELFFPVMSDDSSPVRRPRSPRAESLQHLWPPAQPAHLATPAQTFRSVAASRPSQGVERARALPSTKPNTSHLTAWTRTPSTGAPPSPSWTSSCVQLYTIE